MQLLWDLRGVEAGKGNGGSASTLVGGRTAAAVYASGPQQGANVRCRAGPGESPQFVAIRVHGEVDVPPREDEPGRSRELEEVVSGGAHFDHVLAGERKEKDSGDDQLQGLSVWPR